MMNILRRFCLVALVLVALCGSAAATCVSNYTTACIGYTVCFGATASSTAPVIPYNAARKYLLIQSESTSLPVYFAIGPSTVLLPLAAQTNVNTIQLPPQSPVPSNFEINALNNPNAIKIMTGAISIIAPSGNVTVCILEHNG